MRKFVVYLLAATLVLTGAGCSGSNSFKEIDQATQEGLLALLQSAALGGRGEYIIQLGQETGEGFLKEISGSIEGLAAAEVVSLNFYEGKLAEIGRGNLAPDGKWGPLPTVSGDRAFLVLEGKTLRAYHVSTARYAGILTAGAVYSDFLINPRDTGLVALALVQGGKLQEAADLLAGLQNIHPLRSGLPAKADIFGYSSQESIDIAATAWAGYAAAVLAGAASDNPDLWREAKAYASYLETATPPADREALLAGWLLFFELSKKETEYTAKAQEWQPVQKEGYDPYQGLHLLLTKGNLKKYVDTDYSPATEAERWIHYSLLAAIKALPKELVLAVEDVPGGKAVVEDGKISLGATSWMFIALMGGL